MVKPDDLVRGHYYRVTYSNGKVANNVYTVECITDSCWTRVITRNGKPYRTEGKCYGASSIVRISKYDAENPGKPVEFNSQVVDLLKKN